ncbi:MAG: hypothetical protein JNM63_00740, partial [Spirochaetia bacterium]|nr:hypothetical protein [Spirochaetia bacterium]
GGVWGAKSPYRDTQLFISHRGKLLENIPDNPEQQFLSKPLGLSEFLAQPLVGFRFLSLGLEWKTDVASLVKKDRVKDPKDPFKRFFKVEDWIQADDRVIRLELLAPENVSLFAALLDGQGKKIESHAFTRSENGKVICEFSAPSTGSFSAYLSARKNPEEKLFSKVYEFQLRSDLGAGPDLPAPGKLHLLEGAQRYGLRIVDSDVTSLRGRLFLEWEASKSTVVYSAIWDAEDKKIDGSAESKILSVPESAVQKGRITYAVPTKTGAYILKVRVKRVEDKLYNETAAVARIIIP